MEETILDVRDLHTCYRTRLGETVHPVDGISLALNKGEVLGIAGESGCGKSTLALSLMGFYFPPLRFISGSIIIEDTDIMTLPYVRLRKDYLGKKIAYIPQSAMNALNPTGRVIGFFEDILTEHRKNTGRKQVRRIVEERFEMLRLPRRALNCYPNELSGGMKQRIIIAISTILDPDILIADEPTSALDVSSQRAAINMLLRLIKEGYVGSMIFITHELPLLRHVADNIMVMYAGKIMETGTMSDIIFNPIHPYSKALVSSIIVPEKGIKSISFPSIPGAPPNLKNRITGCRFADRCRYDTADCRLSDIPDREWNGRKYRCILDRRTLEGEYGNE